MVSAVESAAIAVAQDEMQARSRSQRYSLCGIEVSIEHVATQLEWDMEQLCRALALEIGGRIDLGLDDLIRIA